MIKTKSADLQASYSAKRSLSSQLSRHWQLYLFLLPAVAYLVIFKYWPMYGLQLAFKTYNFRLGFSGSPWVGLRHFQTFFRSFQFVRLLTNTIGLSAYQIAAGFTPPIILAIALNECRHPLYKKTVQMVTYMPYFISTVLVVGIMLQVLSLRGIVNTGLAAVGLPRVQFLGDPTWFKTIYVFSGVWQHIGYSAIIYLAALSGVDPELYEAAIIDGASIWRRIWHIDMPGIAPTAIILLILSTARVLNVGFEKVFLLQNPLNMSSSDVISTYVYRMGLVSMQYGFATAVGLFQSLVSFVLLIVVNRVSKRVSEISLW